MWLSLPENTLYRKGDSGHNLLARDFLALLQIAENRFVAGVSGSLCIIRQTLEGIKNAYLVSKTSAFCIAGLRNRLLLHLLGSLTLNQGFLDVKQSQ